MTAPLQELFDDDATNADIIIVDAGVYVPTGVGAPELAFGAVLRRVADARAPRKTVCIGYVTAEGDQELAPALSAARSYVPGDRLVLITRP